MGYFLLSAWAIWTFLIMPVGFTSSPVVSNQCEQSYRLLLKERERDVFWIAENIYGECSQSNLIQVDTESQGVAIARKTTLKEFDRWMLLEQSLKQAIDHEIPIEVLPVNGTLSISALGIKLQTPERNKTLERMYREQFPSECADKWNAGMARGGIDLPVLKNGSYKLLYASPNGLYFNYHIDKAYYFAESRLIIIFTKNNSFRCNGDIATMHGFMILRIDNV